MGLFFYLPPARASIRALHPKLAAGHPTYWLRLFGRRSTPPTGPPLLRAWSASGVVMEALWFLGTLLPQSVLLCASPLPCVSCAAQVGGSGGIGVPPIGGDEQGGVGFVGSVDGDGVCSAAGFRACVVECSGGGERRRERVRLVGVGC